MTSLRRLNLLFAAHHVRTVTALLTEHHPSLPSFSLLKAEGYGDDLAPAAPVDRPDENTERRILSLVLPEHEAADVIVCLCIHAGSMPVVWWTEPVESFGRLQ